MISSTFAGGSALFALAGRGRASDSSGTWLFASAIALSLLLLVVVLVVAVPRITRSRHAAWETVAAQLGLRFTPGGSGLLHRPALMEGVVDGVPVRVDTMSTGRRHLTRVRAAAGARISLDGHAAPLDALGARQISIGYEGPDVFVSWLGYETDPNVIRVACGIVATASRGGR